MNTLVERLADHAREQGSVTAARDRATGEWRFLAWSELQGEVNRLAGALEARAARGGQYVWSAPAGTRRLALDLALLHLGAVGVLTEVGSGAAADGEQWTAAAYAGALSTREQAGRLVRLLAELRPRDPAVVRGGRVMDHAAVAALAERLAGRIAAASPAPVLVTGSAGVEQAVGWAAVWGGFALAVGGADVLPAVQPAVWVTTPQALREVGLSRSRMGALGRLTRTMGDADQSLGSRLVQVYVDGVVPAEAEALRDRGVEVRTWTE